MMALNYFSTHHNHMIPPSDLHLFSNIKKCFSWNLFASDDDILSAVEDFDSPENDSMKLIKNNNNNNTAHTVQTALCQVWRRLGCKMNRLTTYQSTLIAC